MMDIMMFKNHIYMYMYINLPKKYAIFEKIKRYMIPNKYDSVNTNKSPWQI